MCVTEEYQLAMMRRLRRVNVDHFHVGWYQSADVGNFLSLPLLESQYHYQTSIEEFVVVIYGKYGDPSSAGVTVSLPDIYQGVCCYHIW